MFENYIGYCSVCFNTYTYPYLLIANIGLFLICSFIYFRPYIPIWMAFLLCVVYWYCIFIYVVIYFQYYLILIIISVCRVSPCFITRNLLCLIWITSLWYPRMESINKAMWFCPTKLIHLFAITSTLFVF